MPARPKLPNEILVPKIVGPKITLVPRYGLDVTGKWVVSHSPYIRLRSNEQDEDLLLLLTAVMNSSIAAWFIGSNARRFRGGYTEAGVSQLRRMPVPN